MFGRSCSTRLAFFAFRFRGFVDAPRFLAFFDVALDEALADLHFQSVHCGCFRQREEIDAFNPTFGRVLETLGHACARDRAGDVHVEIGHNAGRREKAARNARAQQQGSSAGFASSHQPIRAICLLRADRAGGNGEKKRRRARCEHRFQRNS